MHTRRTFLWHLARLVGAGTLGSAALTTITGCDARSDEPAPDPEAAQLQGLLATTAALADRYQAALSAVAALPATVGQIRDSHLAHARAVAQALGTPTPRPSASTAGAVPGPAERDATLAALMAAENEAYEKAVALCLTSSPRFAALLGSIAAARATHRAALS